jgi:superfamily II DNA or RNA helicase
MTDLRDYQVQAIAEIEQATDKVLYVLPTGGGKTVVASQII